jgi:hypothetical protein
MKKLGLGMRVDVATLSLGSKPEVHYSTTIVDATRTHWIGANGDRFTRRTGKLVGAVAHAVKRGTVSQVQLTPGQLAARKAWQTMRAAA